MHLSNPYYALKQYKLSLEREIKFEAWNPDTKTIIKTPDYIKERLIKLIKETEEIMEIVKSKYME